MVGGGGDWGLVGGRNVFVLIGGMEDCDEEGDGEKDEGDFGVGVEKSVREWGGVVDVLLVGGEIVEVVLEVEVEWGEFKECE